MNTEIQTLQIAYLNAFNEARTQAGKLNNWINFAAEFDKFTRLHRRAADLLKTLIERSKVLNLTINGTQLFSFQNLADAANTAAALKIAYETAATRSADNKLKPGFKDHAAALKSLYLLAFDYSTNIYIIYNNKIDEIATPPLPEIPYPKDPVTGEPDLEAPVEPQNPISANNVLIWGLIAAGLIVFVLIFRRIKK